MDVVILVEVEFPQALCAEGGGLKKRTLWRAGGSADSRCRESRGIADVVLCGIVVVVDITSCQRAWNSSTLLPGPYPAVSGQARL